MRKVELRMNEQKKYDVIKKLVDTNGNKKRAANKLGCTTRHINRMIAGYREFGKAYFIHGNRGRKPAIALSYDEKNNIVDLYTSKYFDCTYTLFAELLARRENINISVDEVRNILRENYILSPRAHKVTRKRLEQELIQLKKNAKTKKEINKIQANIVANEDAHPRQPRCIYFGEEIQIDACKHLWFGQEKTTLHLAIDDATGRIVAGFFDKEETLKGYYNLTYQILKQYGIPYKFKADRRTVFEYKRKGTISDEDDTFTQFAYACQQLGTSIEVSSVPEFKSRVERAFGTLQHRITVELRLANISTINEANEFLKHYIKAFNEQFALCIDNTKNVFELQPNDQQINLILSVLTRRTIDSGHSIKFKKKYYQTLTQTGHPVYYIQKTPCMVIESFDGSLFASVGEKIFALEEIPEVQAKSENFDEICPSQRHNIYVPKMSHPYKRASFEKFLLTQQHRQNLEQVC